MKKSGIFIYVILGFLIAFGIFCAIFFSRPSHVTYIAEHSGLDLTGKYDKEEVEERNSGDYIGKYYIKDDDADDVRSYIKSNWKDGLSEVDSGVITKDQTFIDKELDEDAKYVTAYSFRWTPKSGEGSKQSTEMWAFVADKSDEMYIVFAPID